MNEGDFSKRDAFVLLEADFPIMMDTNQPLGGLLGVNRLKTSWSNPWKHMEKR